MTEYRPAPSIIFFASLLNGQQSRDIIKSATSPIAEYPRDNGVTYYLSEDKFSGYGVNGGELIAVFSIPKGRGDELIQSAISNGATHLDCFDGYLPAFYTRNGFTEYNRVDNWIAGGRDVVYMRLG
jgi:hypothetical protein